MEDWLKPMPLAELFEIQQPIEVDMGSGKGRFLLARATAHPDTNYLGIDRMLRRIRKVDRRIRHVGLHNVRLLRMDAYYATTYLIPPSCVRAYYIFFPDPWPKKRHYAHRFFNEEYLDALARTLLAGGRVNVATDHLPYFEEIRERLMKDDRFEEVETFVPSDDEKTDFELYYDGRKSIGRCSFAKKV